MKPLIIALLNIVGIVAQAQVPTDKTLLWEVSGNGIDKPSYLYGTIHLACPDDVVIPPLVKQKFDATNELFLEIDMDDPTMMPKMMKAMQMKDSTITELLGNDFEAVSARFQKATGMPLSMMNRTKPFMLMSLVYPSLLGCPPASWETEFQKLAKQQGKEIKGLEKLEDQVQVFEKIPYKVQAEMLAKTLDESDSTRSQFQQMMDLYKQKDITQLNISQDDDFSAYEDVLLKDRNRNWIPIIGEQARKSPTFFAFGAGHLGGDTGVIHLLRQSGFKVKPLFY